MFLNVLKFPMTNNVKNVLLRSKPKSISGNVVKLFKAANKQPCPKPCELLEVPTRAEAVCYVLSIKKTTA